MTTPENHGPENYGEEGDSVVGLRPEGDPGGEGQPLGGRRFAARYRRPQRQYHRSSRMGLEVYLGQSAQRRRVPH